MGLGAGRSNRIQTGWMGSVNNRSIKMIPHNLTWLTRKLLDFFFFFFLCKKVWEKYCSVHPKNQTELESILRWPFNKLAQLFGSEISTCITSLHCFMSPCSGLTLIPCEGLHTDMKSYMVDSLHTHSTNEWMPGMVCGRLRVGEWVFSSLCQGCVGVYGSLTSRSWSVDIRYFSQSEADLMAGVWSCMGGGKPYIMTLNLRQRSRTIWKSWEDWSVLQQNTTCTASWRPWPSSSSVLFYQYAGPWEVITICLCSLKQRQHAVHV